MLKNLRVSQKISKNSEIVCSSFVFTHPKRSLYFLFQPVASTINTLAGALYKVFCASPDLAMKEMRQACFDYLSLGGVFSSGPIALLSGLNPRPMSLVAHFFAVAIFGVGRLLVPFPSLKKLWLGTRLLRVSNYYYYTCQVQGYILKGRTASTPSFGWAFTRISLDRMTSCSTTLYKYIRVFGSNSKSQGYSNKYLISQGIMVSLPWF